MTSATASADLALFGSGATTHIVSVEPDGGDAVWVYRRSGETVTRERAPYLPWLLLAERPDSALPAARFTELEGPGYHILAEFPDFGTYHEARYRIRDAHLLHLSYPPGAKQALIRSGETLFKGMLFEDTVRMQFDLETDGLDPAPESARILLIAVSDNRGLLTLIEGDEEEILREFVRLVSERDPDVLEGHNIYGFDLPFLIARAARHGVRLALGRDASEPRQGPERNYASGGSSRPFTPVYVHGRHLLDTYLVVQRFDWAAQALSSYGLKECARAYGFASEERVELARASMAALYRDSTDLVRTYARQDAIETAKLAELISPTEFYQTQMVPDNYGQVVVTGNGEKINAMLVRAYLQDGQSVPMQQSARSFGGGYTEVREFGLLHRVVKADVESLYPSIMLTHRIAPASDTLGVFLPMLGALTRRRIDAKRHAAESRDTAGEERAAHYWDGLQSSFKVLINSFYGYLGGPFYWNDFAAADRVTEHGRELVQRVSTRMGETGSRIIEIDTDGVYFIPPAEVDGLEAERAYIKEVGAVLPDGIRLAFDGRYAAMLSLKTKNYVLVQYDGKRIFRGASLRSRAEERYGRRFLAEAVDRLVERDYDGVATLYAKTIDDILNHRIPIGELARRERVTEKTFSSDQKRRSARVAEGVAIGEHVMVYERTSGDLGLLDQYANDENTRYYLDKLYKFARRLDAAFGSEFDRCIPKPTSQGLPTNLQTAFDLF